MPVTPRTCHNGLVSSGRTLILPGGNAIARGMRRGFTLIEMMIVVVIIAAISSIAIAQLGSSREAVVEQSIKSDLNHSLTAAQAYYARNLTYDDLVVANLNVALSSGNVLTVIEADDWNAEFKVRNVQFDMWCTRITGEDTGDFTCGSGEGPVAE